ncbi:hypothetical protein HKW74_12745 [Pseudomonas aeruginosa]|nr:hypothetical protein [Pseudomonas aeruginosa]MBF3227907.1 hypothetical protein [Pseudomonas aeruginosa]MBF3241099.1 hypothetical protein [Pseudomonas aeruginosa]MBF3251634.1 hypothetical protein [Pseudomonas aeruginosa]MBF3258234.1 hypothetical protein [Pseudomonas aeruginosa]
MPTMPHRQRASDKDLWSRTLSLVFLGFLCYAFPWSVFAAPLPIPTDDTPALRIQGSNTIGAKLLPALVEGLMEEEGLEDIRRTSGERENELHLIGKSRDGRLVRVELSAHGSSTGFAALLERHAELAAASRPVKDSEVRALAGFGDLRSPYAEQVIAIDGLAIILHPDNPLASLDTAQLAAVFAGEVRTWEELGGKGGAIRRVTDALDPRQYHIVPIAAPTEEERAQPYLWRFWRHIPARRQFTIFDRSWYGRVLVERIEGFCAPADWLRAYGEINDFEEQLSEYGIIVVKFWLAIDKQTQMERFKEREKTPYKRYKITEEDWRNRDKWDQYVDAVGDMVDRTSTEIAPWTLVEANDKRFARVKVLRTINDAIEAAYKKDK